MATDFGPATVKVSLNVGEAKRQIEELRREIRLSVPVAVQGKSPVQAGVLKKTNPKAGHPSSSGDVSDDPYMGNDPYWTHDNVADGLRLLKWLKQTDRMRKFAPAHIAKAAEDASLVNRGADWIKDKAGLTEEAAGTVGGIAATTAVVYGATHLAAQVAPLAVRGLEGAGVALPPNVKKFFDDFQSVIANLEHRISNIVKAPKEAFDLWANGARITGKLPDFMYYWNQMYDIGVAQDDLGSAFDRFKRNEVAQAVGKSIGETFKPSLDR